MPRKRGRPRKVLPIHPNRVISTAMRRGLSATLELQRDIKNKKTTGLYGSSRELLSGATSVYLQTTHSSAGDHSYITQIENNVRRNMLDMCWEDASAYGNTEVRRVKRSDETVGPLNQGFNVCGAELRDFGMTMFPFQEPELFGYQTRRMDGRPTTFRLMGYQRNSYGPHTPLVHPDLPSLDFADTIRHHLDYLVTFCYRYNVMSSDTGRYWNLYQLRARPYLEYIYSESSSGKRGFREGTRQVLREIKEDIRKHYSLRTGETPTVTGSLDVPKPSFSTDFFSNLIAEARGCGIEGPAIEELERLHTTVLDYDESRKKKVTYLREQDVRNIWQRISKRVIKTGSQVHRTISFQLSSPWTLRDIIVNSDSFSGDDRHLVSFEVPVDTVLGKGKVDLLLSERVSLKNETQVFQRPVMVFEIKTKQGHSMTLGRKDIWSESRAHHGLDQRVVADFKFNDRALDHDEWESLIIATPTSNSQIQLNAYSDAIWREYQKLTSSKEPNTLITGTILIEATEDIRLIRDMMRGLVLNIHDEVIEHKDHRHRLVFEPKIREKAVRVAVVINERPQTISSEGSTISPGWRSVYDPLQLASTDARRFILYLDGKSPTSSGASAGWIAKFYHGLHMVEEIVDRNDNFDTIWIDLANQFVDPKLAEARLYLRPYSNKEKDIRRSHRDDICQLFESIPVMGLFSDVDGFLFRGKSISSLQTQLEDLPKKNCLIIVSGMETIRGATPESHRWKLEFLLSGIISSLPNHKSVTVIWFDSPVPSETYSTAYSCRTLLPFYESSVLNGVVNEIVWNLPVVSGHEANPDTWPLPTFAKTPYHDDIRIIVLQDQNGFSVESILVPILTDWSKRFRTEGLGEMTSTQDVTNLVPEASVRARMEILALSLIPWIVALWPTQKLDAGHGHRMIQERYEQETSRYLIGREHITLTTRILKGDVGREPTLLERVRFRPEQTRGGKGFASVTVGAINSQRLFRESRRIKTRPKILVGPSTPQVEKRTDLSDIRFGLILSSEDLGYEWRTVVDPNSSSSIKTGLFRINENKTSLDWSVSRLDIISKMSRNLDRFEDKITEFMFKRDPEYDMSETSERPQWLAWSRTEGEPDWTRIGFNDHVLRSSTSKVSLRAFGMGTNHGIASVPVPDVDFPDGLKETIKQTIVRTSRQLKDVKHTNLELETSGNECIIRFMDPQIGKTAHLLRMKNTADIIRLLRYPMTDGKPLRLRNDLHVTWDPFHDFSHPSPDIDFGEDFKFLEPLLISLTTREGMLLSPDVLETAFEHRALQITIRHYPTQCPLVAGSRLDHDSCWGMDPPTEKQFQDLVDSEHFLTDEEVLEAVRRVAQSAGNRRIRIVFDHGSDEDDRLVFNESEVMRELSREYRGIPLQNFAPGHTSRIKLRKRQKTGDKKGPVFIKGTDVPE